MCPRLMYLVIIPIITLMLPCCPSGSGREGGSGKSQGFPGEQHLFRRWPVHHGPVGVRPGSAAQPLCPAGPAPPQPHGHHTRYHSNAICESLAVVQLSRNNKCFSRWRAKTRCWREAFSNNITYWNQICFGFLVRSLQHHKTSDFKVLNF